MAMVLQDEGVRLRGIDCFVTEIEGAAVVTLEYEEARRPVVSICQTPVLRVVKLLRDFPIFCPFTVTMLL
jgi:hypothetical protein